MDLLINFFIHHSNLFEKNGNKGKLNFQFLSGGPPLKFSNPTVHPPLKFFSGLVLNYNPDPDYNEKGYICGMWIVFI